eukprot:183961_1
MAHLKNTKTFSQKQYEFKTETNYVEKFDRKQRLQREERWKKVRQLAIYKINKNENENMKENELTQMDQKDENEQYEDEIADGLDIYHWIQIMKYEQLTDKNEELQQENNTLKQKIDKDSQLNSKWIDEQKIRKKLDEHDVTVGEWFKSSSELQQEFLQYNAQYTSNNMDQKENEIVNVEELYLSYTNCSELLGNQQQRCNYYLDEYWKDLNTQSMHLEQMTENYKHVISETKQRYDSVCTVYDSTKYKRKSSEKQADDMMILINDLIDKENETNQLKCCFEDKYNMLQMELDEYCEILKSGKALYNEYVEFDENVDAKCIYIHKQFRLRWEKHECNWNNWNVNDIIYWFKYLMIAKKILLTDKVDLSVIETEMQKQKVNGIVLHQMSIDKLREIGFSTVTDINQIYNEISELVEKYPVFSSQNVKDSVNIPSEFICPITKDIMDDPVICSDGHSYERFAIEDWLIKHDKSPMTNTKLVTKQIFPNHGLRSMIQEYKMQQNQ